MVNVLILYTDGKREVKNVKKLSDYQEAVNGHIELMPVVRGYVNPDKKTVQPRPKVACYANEEGMMLGLPSNPYAGVLSLIGVRISFNIFVYGNVVLFSGFDAHGNEKAVDPYLVKLFDDYEACEDEDEFYVALEELNKPVKKTTSLPVVQEPVLIVENKSTKRKKEDNSDISTKKAKQQVK